MFARAGPVISCCRSCGANFRAAGLFDLECNRCRLSNRAKNERSENGCTAGGFEDSSVKAAAGTPTRKRPLADMSNLQVDDEPKREKQEQEQEREDGGSKDKQPNVAADVCLFCELDLQHLGSEEKDAHLRECLAAFEAERQDGGRPYLSAIRSPEYECVICGRCLDNRDLTQRLHHIKRCGHKHHMTVWDLIEIMRTHEELADGGEDDNAGELAEDQNEAEDEQQDGAEDCDDVHHGQDDGEQDAGGTPAGPTYSAFDMMMASSKAQQLNAPPRQKGSKRARNSGASQTPSRGVVPPAPVPAGSAVPYCPAFKKVGVPSMAVPIIVDGFKHASPHLSHLYFLSHFHSDHYMGLKSSFDAGVIYCSHVTAALASMRLSVRKQHLCPLALETPADIPVGDTSVRVTLIDANHCPGSTMMLFELPNRTRVLHTGDFRWNRATMEKSRTMRQLITDAKGGHPIDVCYLDTTYLAPQYTFPSQEQAIEEVVETVRTHLAESAATEKVLFLFGAYQIGKERVFMQVAREFNMPVYVDKQRYRCISCYAWPLQEMKLVTQDQSKSNLWVVPMYQLTFKGLAGIRAKLQGRFTKLIAFKPTGWSFDSRSRQLLSVQRQKDCTIYSVPYSEHSSYDELADFIACMRPKRVVPTVDCSTQEKVAEQLKILKQFYIAASEQNQSEFC